MEQLERISYMENILNRSLEAVASLDTALEQYLALKGAMDELFEYYGSALWFSDKADDEEGRLPETLCRGVLSEDSVYDLISDCHRLEDLMTGLGSN